VKVSSCSRFIGAIVLITGTLEAGAATARASSDGPRRCSNSSLNGTFGFVAGGLTLAGSPVPASLQGPFASSGIATFDGRGRLTLTATNSFNGIVQGPATVRATYEVMEDCTYTSQAENGVTFRAVIVNDGDELFILQTTPGVVISGTARKQRHQKERAAHPSLPGSRCDASTLRGTYGFLASGAAGPPTLPAALAGPLQGVGTVAFDERGGFTLVAVRSVNGNLDPEPQTLSGSYQWTSACAFQMTFDVGFTFTATIVDDGDELLFIETDPGTSLTVRARRQ
jgi:hypothetical protein